MSEYRSIVRDGNHFIWLDGKGWVLIDGPWFRVMQDYDNRVFKAPQPKPGRVPSGRGRNYLEWERVYWQHGAPEWLSDRWIWRELEMSRCWIGWRVKGSGILPTHMGSVEPVSE